jgi:hypothetical protein
MSIIIEDNTFNIIGMICFAFIVGKTFTEIAKGTKKRL